MSTDNFLQLTSLVNRIIDIVSLGSRSTDISSQANRTIELSTSVYADEVTDKLRYEDVPTITKVVGTKYKEIKPPPQRV